MSGADFQKGEVYACHFEFNGMTNLHEASFAIAKIKQCAKIITLYELRDLLYNWMRVQDFKYCWSHLIFRPTAEAAPPGSCQWRTLSSFKYPEMNKRRRQRDGIQVKNKLKMEAIDRQMRRAQEKSLNIKRWRLRYTDRYEAGKIRAYTMNPVRRELSFVALKDIWRSRYLKHHSHCR